MTPIDLEIIKRKLSIIIENLRALEPIQNIKQEDYIQDIYKRKATERLLQELIEAAIDINVNLIVSTGHTVPDDYYETFIKVGELNIIPSDLAQKLAPSAGLRNRLVHEYDRLEHSLVLRAVNMAEEIFPQYIKAISGYIFKDNKDHHYEL